MTRATRLACVLLCAMVVFALGGCVERRLFLKSDPPGALVLVNGKAEGLTPTKVDFMTYGNFEIVMSARNHHRIRRTVPIDPPWWETIFIDFFVENLWPFTVVDEHEVKLKLRAFDIPRDRDVTRREAEMRERVEAGEGN